MCSLLSAFLLVACCNTSVAKGDDSKVKGIVLVLIDDIGYGDIDTLYPSSLETPSLDSLCSESVCLTDFHVGTTCAPTRASLMTGRSVNASGVWHTVAGRELLRADEQTMADVFRANGWATGIFGKWHLGDGYPFSPRFRGFDVAVVHGGGGVGQGPDHWGNDYYSDMNFQGKPTTADVYLENGKPITADRFCTDFWFEHAKRFIKSNVDADKPFFCYLPTNAAHGPFHAPHGGKKGFDGLIENIDENMTQLDDFLSAEGIKDDVMLIFTCDNGTAGKRLGGLRGKKGSHYDGGHNVPCFIRWKNGGMGGDVKHKRDVDSLTASMDFLPTFVDLFDLKRPDGGHTLHGVSLKEMLTTPDYQPTSRTMVVDTQRTKDLVKWKSSCVMRDEVGNGKIQHKWRLIRDSEETAPQLFDFRTDRDTDDDVAQSQPDLVASLSSAYESWWSEVSPDWQPYPAFVVNGDQEPELTLFAHSWIGRDSSPWNQNQVRNGAPGTGVHSIQFAKPGRYEIELRRWPREDGGTISGSSKVGTGKALPVSQAQIELGTGSQTRQLQSVAPNDAAVQFSIDVVDTEPTTLKTALLDGDGNVLTGAFVVYIRRADP